MIILSKQINVSDPNNNRNNIISIYLNNTANPVYIQRMNIANNDDYVASYSISVAKLDNSTGQVEFDNLKQYLFPRSSPLLERQCVVIPLFFWLQPNQDLRVSANNDISNKLALLNVSFNLFIGDGK